jgi:hypothetical protein
MYTEYHHPPHPHYQLDQFSIFGVDKKPCQSIPHYNPQLLENLWNEIEGKMENFIAKGLGKMNISCGHLGFSWLANDDRIHVM